jgi:hypothetical protein
VTLIKNFTVFNDVPVLTGFCPTCETIYHADHERRPSHGRHERVYLNSAHYIKIGQTLWVDRLFTNAVLSGIYNFHASAATYAAYWNSIFVDHFGNLTARVTRRQIWQAFVQESVRLLASEMQINLTIGDGLSVDEITREAFAILGNNGVLRAAHNHSCIECTQKYKESAQSLPHADNSAVVGMDDAGAGIASEITQTRSNSMNDEQASVVKMVVVDGIVMGHTVRLQ